MGLVDKLLYGQNYVEGEGVNSMPGQGGAMQLSEDWTKRYLDWLQNSPDITYNAQRGALEGNIQASMEQAAKSLGARGVNTRDVVSGTANKTLANMAGQRAGLLAQLEGDRQDRTGQRLGQGTQLTQGLLDRALNVRSAAAGTALNQQTQIPQMLMNQSAGQNAQAGAFGNLTGTLLDYYAQSRQPTVQVPTTVPVSGYASTTPNQFADFKFKSSGFGSY